MELLIARSIGESNCGVDSVNGIFCGGLVGGTSDGKAGIAAPIVDFASFHASGDDSANDWESKS